MLVKPPPNSTITVAGSGRAEVISIPYRKAPVAAYMVGMFLLCWLLGWAFGEITAIYQIVTTPIRSRTIFLIVWVCMWTVGGGIAILVLRRLVQRSVPETLSLDADGLVQDLGIPPFQMPSAGNIAAWSSLFPSRKQRKIDRSQLNSLRLRDGDTRNRLTVDVGADRVELARDATDVEREWLFKMISDRYSLVTQQ